jgi:hypothetical protein
MCRQINVLFIAAFRSLADEQSGEVFIIEANNIKKTFKRPNAGGRVPAAIKEYAQEIKEQVEAEFRDAQSRTKRKDYDDLTVVANNTNTSRDAAFRVEEANIIGPKKSRSSAV